MYNTIPYNFAEYNIDGLTTSNEGVFLKYRGGWMNIMDTSKYSINFLHGDSLKYRSSFIERRDFGEYIDVYMDPFSMEIMGTIIEDSPASLQEARYDIKSIEREGLIYRNRKGVKKYAEIVISKISFDEVLVDADRFSIDMMSERGRYTGKIKRHIVDQDGEVINNSFRPQEGELNFLSTETGDFTVGINGVDLTVPGVQSGDVVYIDMQKKIVTINGDVVGFDGIMGALKHGMNSITYSLTGTLDLFAKKYV